MWSMFQRKEVLHFTSVYFLLLFGDWASDNTPSTFPSFASNILNTCKEEADVRRRRRVKGKEGSEKFKPRGGKVEKIFHAAHCTYIQDKVMHERVIHCTIYCVACNLIE